MKIDLEGRRALVTGGNSGIGEGIVVSLAGAGARVAINYNSRPADAQSLAQRIEEGQGVAMALEADVSDPDAVTGMFDRVDHEWGGLDILVNNAGIDGKRALGWEADPAAWRQVIDVNLIGAFLCAREALRLMVPQQSGVIINITSVHELIAWSGYSAYAASKAGLSMLSKTLAQEAAPHGVRVLAVAPGAIRTPINRPVWSDPQGLRDLLEKIPLNRIGEPADIGDLVAVLASDVASYVTGRTVFVDGGMTDYPDFAHGG